MTFVLALYIWNASPLLWATWCTSCDVQWYASRACRSNISDALGKISDLKEFNYFKYRGCSDSKATDGMVICPRHYMCLNLCGLSHLVTFSGFAAVVPRCFNLKTGENVEGDFTMKQKASRVTKQGVHNPLDPFGRYIQFACLLMAST